MTSSLTVLLPVFNEEQILRENFMRAYEFLASRGYDFEVLNIDDASRDRTASIAGELAQQYPRVRVHRHETNQGPCSGLRSGIALARKEWVLLLPADLAIPLHDIGTLWDARNDCDIVVGYVRQAAARGWARRIQSAAYARVVNLLFGTSFRQINYVSLYRLSVVQPLTLTTTGVALHAEILVRAARGGCRFRQVGLGFHERSDGVASGARPAVIGKTMREIVTLRMSL